MPLVEIHDNIYTVNNSEVQVDWAAYDFREDVAGIPNISVRTTLEQTGVMYVPATTPAIRVSHLLSIDLQGLSALHEELCMNQKTAACPSVEEQVVDSILSPQLQTDFITTRIRMFGALCTMDESNKDFKATFEVLSRRV